MSEGFDDVPQPRVTLDHCHAPKKEDGLHRKCVDDMKRLARSGTTPIPQIYQSCTQELHTADMVAGSTLPTESSLSATLHRSRRSRYPRLPESLNDLQQLLNVFTHTGVNHQERFLVANTVSQANGSIVFATNIGIEWLVQYVHWHMDGTFKSAPRLFTQVFTIHIIRSRKTIPCAYCLLPSKSKQCYQGVLRSLKDFADANHLHLAP